MAHTVDASFKAFYDQINLSGDHRETANTRRNQVAVLGFRAQAAELLGATTPCGQVSPALQD